MDLNAARSKQRAAQQQAQTQPDGVARIGDRDPLTGRYTVQLPDGGIGANGIKTYTAMSKPGDVVVMYPRPDGSIALDSEKGSPTIVPDVFNKPVPDKKKGGVWIFYRSAGKLWIGGHQAAPEEIATLSVVANTADPASLHPSGYHVWGDKNGWVATFQVTERLPLIVNGNRSGLVKAINFYCVYNADRVTTQNVVRKMVGQSSESFHANSSELIPSHSVFPLGGGFVSFRSNITPNVTPVGSGGMVGTGLADFAIFTFSGSVSASVGYLNLGVTSIETFEMAHVNVYTNGISGRAAGPCTASTHRSQLSFDGTTRIPNVGICQYKGNYVSRVESVFLAHQNNTPREFSTQSILTYAIMCDRSATYYIRETISATGITVVNAIDYSACFTSVVTSPVLGFTADPLRKYELFSSASAQVLATNLVEPRFFGIRWDLRDSRFKSFETFLSNASIVSAFYNDPRYYCDSIVPFTGRLGSSDQGVMQPESVALSRGALAVGGYRRSRIQTTSLPVYDYDDGTPATYSGGSVVQIPATEIVKATIGDGYLIRRVMEVGGTFSTLRPIYCHTIPADAVILHWSTTADEP